MTIKEQGVLKYGRLIQQNIDQARYLEQLVEAAQQLELALPVSLNVVNFRFFVPDLDNLALDALNKGIEVELQEQGIAADFHQLLLDIQKRDHDDSTREIAPLLRAKDAIYIDSSDLSCEAVVEKMLTETRKIVENH